MSSWDTPGVVVKVLLARSEDSGRRPPGQRDVRRQTITRWHRWARKPTGPSGSCCSQTWPQLGTPAGVALFAKSVTGASRGHCGNAGLMPRKEPGLYVWTAADFDAGLAIAAGTDEARPIESGEPVDVALLRQGRLPNLQREFAGLASVFD